MIPQSFIQDLLNRVDIVDVVESYVPLKRAGANFAARCPFHTEKSPSFTVSQTKQFYHCFGCGAHGTAISFLMEHQGMGFIDAVKDLAGRVGMQVPEQAPDPRRQEKVEAAEDLTEVTLKAAQFYKAQLKSSDKAVAYLKNRGLTGEIAARYGLGYAPEGWQGLEAVFPDYQAKSLNEAGLVILSEEGRRYDRFRDRVMFPIHNQRGVIIGFGGRVIDQGEPKYLNSPETPLFEKGRELYGLYQARQAIRDAGMVVVVEGYMDVVSLAQYGVGYAVATLGTSCTAEHIQKLFRQTDKVIFCFDGDAAGQKAARRALDNCLPAIVDGKYVSFLLLPADHDPDTFVRDHGVAEFENQVKRARPLSEFLVSILWGAAAGSSEEGRSRILQEARPLLESIRAPIFSTEIRSRIASALGQSTKELESILGLSAIKHKDSRLPPARSLDRKKPSLNRRIIKCLLARPHLCEGFSTSQITELDVESEALAALVSLLQGGEVKTGITLSNHFAGTKHHELLRELEGEVISEWSAKFDVESEFASSIQGLESKRRDQTVAQLLRKRDLEGWSLEDKEEYRRLHLRADVK